MCNVLLNVVEIDFVQEDFIDGCMQCCCLIVQLLGVVDKIDIVEYDDSQCEMDDEKQKWVGVKCVEFGDNLVG